MNLSLFYTKYLPSILFIGFILVDSINGYLQVFYGVHSPIGIITRGIILIILLPLLRYSTKSLMFPLFKVILFLMLLSLPIWYINENRFNFLDEIQQFL